MLQKQTVKNLQNKLGFSQQKHQHNLKFGVAFQLSQENALERK
jgi:hypothetical protein